MRLLQPVQHSCNNATVMSTHRGLLRPPDIQPVDFFGMITVSRVMLDVFDLIRKAARTEVPVLLRGETGSGKELAAHAIHRLSRRASGPFQAINCATLTREMLASELFGHVRGAFTGAVRDRPGLLRLTHGGTLFLDEVAELPLDIQSRLLRVLQEQRFMPLGGSEWVRVDVRLVSATLQALRRAVVERRFRVDLMYRIRVVPVFLPPLRDRPGDVEALVWHFIARFNEQDHWRHIEAVESEAMEALVAYRWPGNVRELINVLQYAFAMGEGPLLKLGDLTPELRGEPPPEPLDPAEALGVATPPNPPCGDPEAERARILDALRQARGRRGEAAELLGMSRTTLWRKMRELGIGPNAWREPGGAANPRRHVDPS